MAGHTPSPWSAQPSELGPDDVPYHWYVVAGNGRYDPAIVNTWPGSVNPEGDARLMSAAPDLLEALEWLLASVEADPAAENYPGDREERLTLACGAAHTALRKASGAA